MSSEASSPIAVSWLKPATKDALARFALPWLRNCLRVTPFSWTKELLWRHFIGPHLWWREYAFVARTKFGAKVAGTTADAIQAYIYYFGVWEPNLTAWIASRLKPGDVFVDVGAHIGYFSLLASRLVGPKGGVVAIEPSPQTFALLRRNLYLNQARNVRPVNAAVSDKEEELQLFLPTGNDSGWTTVVHDQTDPDNFRRGPAVRALPLAGILHRDELAAVRLIKIDVEGYEGHILSSLAPLLESCRADLEIIAEISPSRLQREYQSPSALLSPFRSLGFHFYEIENSYKIGSYLVAKIKRPLRLGSLSFNNQKDLIFSRMDGETL